MRSRLSVVPRLLALAAVAAAGGARAAGRQVGPRDAPTPAAAPPVGATPMHPAWREPGRDVFRIAFEGDAPAEVSIAGNGRSALSLHVFSSDGALICEDVRDGDRKTCRWRPAATAEFVVEVRNSGAQANDYLLWTN
jgi:hypothetical protein